MGDFILGALGFALIAAICVGAWAIHPAVGILVILMFVLN